jgi:hypothetical protein
MTFVGIKLITRGAELRSLYSIAVMLNVVKNPGMVKKICVLQLVSEKAHMKIIDSAIIISTIFIM